MTAIIHGFIIAGFIVLAAAYIRLGFILDEIMDALRKRKDSE